MFVSLPRFQVIFFCNFAFSTLLFLLILLASFLFVFKFFNYFFFTCRSHFLVLLFSILVRVTFSFHQQLLVYLRDFFFLFSFMSIFILLFFPTYIFVSFFFKSGGWDGGFFYFFFICLIFKADLAAVFGILDVVVCLTLCFEKFKYSKKKKKKL